MTRIAGRLTPQLAAELVAIDDGRLPVAEVNRRLGEAAERLGLQRLSYERVRTLVGELRRSRLRLGPTTTEVLRDIAWRARPPQALFDHLLGLDVRERYVDELDKEQRGTSDGRRPTPR
jgi:hypothetical protein